MFALFTVRCPPSLCYLRKSLMTNQSFWLFVHMVPKLSRVFVAHTMVCIVALPFLILDNFEMPGVSLIVDYFRVTCQTEAVAKNETLLDDIPLTLPNLHIFH